MSNQYRELIERFQAIQPGFCEFLSHSLTKVVDCECTLTFNSISTTNLENALRECPGKASLIGFTFEEIPSLQWIILSSEQVIDKKIVTNVFASYFSLTPASVEILDTPPFELRAVELLCSRYRLDIRDNSQTLLWLFDEGDLQRMVGESVSNIEEENVTASVKPSQKERDFEILMDIPLDINVELGRVKLTIQKILELTPGNIIELEKTAGEPVDVFVNGRLVAKGEVVVVEENFGVRITEILSPHDRIGKLSEAA